jgi:choice-of-anchor C domain-containing protein
VVINLNIRKIFLGVVSTFFAISITTVAAFALGTDGSFELGSDPGSSTLLSGGSTISDWLVQSGNIDYVGHFWQASDGSRSIDLNGNQAGSISQTFATVVGTTYIVEFDMSGNPVNSNDSNELNNSYKSMTVSVTGESNRHYSYDTLSKNNSLIDMKWEKHAFSFAAQGTSTTLTFSSGVTGSFGPALDNVIIREILPTEKDQCKGSGWENYLVFNNQGDCVSYISTSGDNPPSNL